MKLLKANNNNNNDNLLSKGLSRLSELQRENQIKPNGRQILELCLRTKKALKEENDGDPIVIGALGTISKSLERGLE